MAFYQPPPGQTMPGTKPPKPVGGAMLQEKHRPNTVSTGPAPIGRQQPPRWQGPIPDQYRPPNSVSTGPAPVQRQPRVITGTPTVNVPSSPPQAGGGAASGPFTTPPAGTTYDQLRNQAAGTPAAAPPQGGGLTSAFYGGQMPGGNTVSTGPAPIVGLPASGPGSMASYLPGPGGGGGQKPDPPPISPGGGWAPPGGGDMNKPIPIAQPRPGVPRPTTPTPRPAKPPAGTSAGTGRLDSLWANPGGHKGVARFQKQYGTGADAKKQWMKARTDWQTKRRAGKPGQPVKPGLPAGRTDPRPVEEQPVAPGDANKPRNPPTGGRRGGGGGSLGGRG